MIRQWSFVTVLMIVIGGCGSRQPAKEPRGVLRFTCNVPDAIVHVDEVRLGPIHMFSKSGVLLRPGAHRIVVTHADYFEDYRLVRVDADTVRVEIITLREIPR